MQFSSPENRTYHSVLWTLMAVAYRAALRQKSYWDYQTNAKKIPMKSYKNYQKEMMAIRKS